MESTGAASPFDSFKSKKVLRSTVKPALPDEPSKSADPVPWTSKTPEKPINRRATARRTAMSVGEIRREAEKLRTSVRVPVDQPDPVLSSVSHTETPAAKSSPKQLPEKYEILDKFFNSLDSSIRLLRLKGLTSTFTNISPKIECLTDRRFSYNNLAQIKFILPEAIEIKKILTRDERTSCMRPDLHITLHADAVESEGKMKSDTGSLHLRKVFRARLHKFCKANPEDDDIPEGELPEPFNRSKQDSSANKMNSPSLTLVQERATDSIPEQQPMVASLLSKSFQRRFSKEVASSDGSCPRTIQEPSKAPLLPAPEPHVDQISSRDGSCPSAAASHIKWSPKIIEKRDVESCVSVGSSRSALLETPIKNSCLEKQEDVTSMESESIQATPAKLISTPAKLMSATPAQRPPKRCFISPDADLAKSPNKLVRRPNRSRSLKFDTPLKNETGSSHRQLEDDDIFDILPDNLLESIKEKERKAMEEKDPAISQAKWRQQMIANLPKLYDMLLFFFQSIKRTVITKEELVHRIISSQLEITDRREVDEQLRLLQELAPEWIYEKMGSTGDMLLCVNKISSAESIRTRIAEAQ